MCLAAFADLFIISFTWVQVYYSLQRGQSSERTVFE